MHSILADHSFNLDVNALVGKVHTISAKRKTISAESIQFRKCLIRNCKRFPSSPWLSVIQTALWLPVSLPWSPKLPCQTNVWPRKQSGPFSEFGRSVTGQGRFRAAMPVWRTKYQSVRDSLQINLRPHVVLIYWISVPGRQAVRRGRRLVSVSHGRRPLPAAALIVGLPAQA